MQINASLNKVRPSFFLTSEPYFSADGINQQDYHHHHHHHYNHHQKELYNTNYALRTT